ncbi:MAG: CBS domain-containing protein [Saprospiraceae bacterium]|jgi:CBS domain-containing protein|nr:CBS domain-containing protein [Saprospiraceae bacterium]MBP6237373.1 CBS domain-containing protein [Saprospiraceae bacterium]MBP6569228.1 CBS domain-containing protein [Saprospiraceae bacterium]MBP9196651.1 CBS domain-containing protein [Saprospiraceae bacterium]
MMNQEVRSIMTKDPVVASPTQTIDEVSDLMMQSQMQQLPVVVDGKLMGMITSYDLWKATREGHGTDMQVKDVMTTKVVRITPKDKVGTAAELFADKRFKTLPVVNLNNELKGVVTAFDVIKCAFNEEYPVPILYQDVFEH